MPAQSRKQQQAADIALAVKEGKKSPKTLRGASKQMYQSMSMQELRELAETRFGE
jgi:hypothetical protein